jgi:flavin-dependent dehydrogenase
MAARLIDPDILIIGGGPAGGAAAIQCALRGLHVVLVEREGAARDKPGEALHPGIEPLLAQLGVADRLDAVTGARHAGVWIEWAGGRRFEPFGEDAVGPWRGFQVRRRDFDALLLERARELGADVRQGCRAIDLERGADGLWRVDTADGPIACPIVIDATGGAGWLARKLRLSAARHSPPLVARYGYAEGSCPARDEAPVLVGDGAGWTWTARVAPGLYQWVRLDLDEGAEPTNPVPEELRALKPRGAARGADVTWRLSGAAAGPGWSIAGDAAATLDPASSHGVLKAIMSGMMAAHLAARVLRDGAAPEEAAAAYRDWLRGWFAADVARLSGFYRQLGVAGFARRAAPA